MIDLHAHILPSIDDGPEDWETSVEMCKIASADGIKKIVATPHINDVYHNDLTIIQNGVDELNRRIKGILDMKILVGADAHLTSDFLLKVKKGEIPTVNHKNYMLLELPHTSITVNLKQIVFELKLAGIFPILTHPERNMVIQNNPSMINDLVDAGLTIQITGMSLTGGFGKRPKKCAEKLLKDGLIHNIVTDCHSREGRKPLLSPSVKMAKKIVGERTVRMMVSDIPNAILEGRDIAEFDLTVAKKRWFFFNW